MVQGVVVWLCLGGKAAERLGVDRHVCEVQLVTDACAALLVAARRPAPPPPWVGTPRDDQRRRRRRRLV